jgi:hypothetical protein
MGWARVTMGIVALVSREKTTESNVLFDGSGRPMCSLNTTPPLGLSMLLEVQLYPPRMKPLFLTGCSLVMMEELVLFLVLLAEVLGAVENDCLR